MKTGVLFLTLLVSINVCLYGQQSSQIQSIFDPPRIKDPKEIIDLQISSLDHLIAMTERTLNQLSTLRQQVKEYKEIQEQYLRNTDNNELLYRMMKTAHQLLKNIKADNLTHSFEPEFMSELNTMSQIYNKIGLPKP